MVLNLMIIGLTITLEPIPLTAFIVILASARGARKGAAFIAGWFLSLAIVVVLTLLVTGNRPPKPNTAPSLAAIAVKIAVGAVLLVIALRQYRRIGRPRPPKKTPAWQTGADNMSPWFAFVLGPLTQPWGLVAAGVATISEAKLSSWQSYFALAAFCLVSTFVYLAMEIYALLRPAETQEFLSRTRQWIEHHKDQVIIGVSLVLGLWLIGTSVYVLTS